MYSPIVPIDVTAISATGGTIVPFPGRPVSVIRNAAAELPMTAIVGTPLGLTRAHSLQPGIARSRENAKNVRELLVTHAIPQNSWPTTAIRITISAQFWFMSAEVKTESEVPKASFTALTSVAENVIARRTNQPISAELTTDCQTPLAAACSASCVSSDTWAEAS